MIMKKKILMGGGINMVLGDLKQAFSQKKGYCTENANELLDFARHWYLEGKICISDYRTLIKRIRNKRRNKTYNNDRSIKITRGLSLLLFTLLNYILQSIRNGLVCFKESFTFTFIYKALQHICL